MKLSNTRPLLLRAVLLGSLVALGMIALVGARTWGGRGVVSATAPIIRDLALLPIWVAGIASAGFVLRIVAGLRQSRVGASVGGFLAALPAAASAALVLVLSGRVRGMPAVIAAVVWSAIVGPIVGIRWLRTESTGAPLSLTPRLRTVLPPHGARKA